MVASGDRKGGRAATGEEMFSVGGIGKAHSPGYFLLISWMMLKMSLTLMFRVLSHKKDQSWVTCRDVEGPRDCRTD